MMVESPCVQPPEEGIIRHDLHNHVPGIRSSRQKVEWASPSILKPPWGPNELETRINVYLIIILLYLHLNTTLGTQLV